MKITKLHTLAILLISQLLLLSGLKADIINVAVSSQNTNVNLNMTGRAQITWTVSEQTRLGGQVTVSSAGGAFYTPDGDLLAQIPVTLQDTRNAQLRMTTLYVIQESLTIPLSVIRTAQKAGHNTFSYRRSFSDTEGSTSRITAVNFRITSSNIASELQVRRIQMEFSDGRTSAVLSRNSSLQARALINYQGTGLLEYSWEVASPPSTKGRPIFVPLISRKQYLLAGDTVTLTSPKLLSTEDGQYFVRLRILKPVSELTMPVVRYAVNNAGVTLQKQQITNMNVATPAENTQLTRGTRFSWQAVHGAKAYQIEMFSQPIRDNGLPGNKTESAVTGVLIPATKTEIKIGNLPRTHLIPGTTYYWRVIALSDRGTVIGKSEFRSINY